MAARSKAVLQTKVGDVLVVDYLEELGDEIFDRAASSTKVARILLVGLADKLSHDMPLTTGEREYLANALSQIAANPDQGGAAFGLKRSRAGHPGLSQSQRLEQLFAGRRVVALHEDHGLPIEDGNIRKVWNGRGAITVVAEERNLSAEHVRRGYRRYRTLRRRISTSAPEPQ